MSLSDLVLFSFEQELVKHTHDAADKNNLKIALDAMKVRVPLTTLRVVMLNCAQPVAADIVTSQTPPLCCQRGFDCKMRDFAVLPCDKLMSL